ncbi:11920_t:CDS:2 [Acaulospora colombiana]|uniref:11920_t:CDS:1 n=1 Tax=Acaulospora colombiana TaxID=27376 RepID=A0ACA9PUK0_9GLOM|nr:11920_t:CDS:2 [Acaulospora colombiana]
MGIFESVEIASERGGSWVWNTTPLMFEISEVVREVRGVQETKEVNNIKQAHEREEGGLDGVTVRVAMVFLVSRTIFFQETPKSKHNRIQYANESSRQSIQMRQQRMARERKVRQLASLSAKRDEDEIRQGTLSAVERD